VSKFLSEEKEGFGIPASGVGIRKRKRVNASRAAGEVKELQEVKEVMEVFPGSQILLPDGLK